MDIKQQIVEALTNSFSPDNQKLKEATAFLTSLRDRPSYCLALMQIADSSNASINLRQSALIQLKNAIRFRWNSTQNVAINDEQKNIIKNTLLTAIIRCNGQMKLIKLYKEILKVIVSHDYNKWNPISFIVEKLRALQDVEPLLHCLIAVGSAFEIRLNDDEKNYFQSFVRIMLPEVANVVKNKQTPQVVYLVIKLLWKCIHFQESLQIKKMSLDWMILIKNVITMKNQKFDKLSQDELDSQDPMTEQFFYFHSKKWSLRIVDLFIQKLAKFSLSKKKKHALEFSQNWYKQYGQEFVQIVFKQLNQPAGNKIRYFQFKIFKSLLSENPKLLKKYAEKLQYDILMKYMRLTPEDQQLVKENPIQFLSRQDDPLTYQYLKSTCTTIWIGIAQIQSEQPKKQKPYKPGTFFQSNILFLKSKLEGTDLIDKQLAMYLICKLQTTIKKSPIKNMLPKLIKDYVIPQFTNKISFLRARALEIFDDYGQLQFDEETLKIVAEKIYICLTQDTEPIVHIKAAIAFKKILNHECVRTLVKPYLKDILTVYLQILDKYDLENVVDSLKTIVEQFSSDVGPYAYDLGQCLIKMFIKLAQKDKVQATQDQYNGQSQLAAGGCLSAIKQIIDSPLDKQAIVKLQPQVIDLIHYIFIKTETDYIDDALALLNSYLFKVETITEQLWELFPIMIYNIIGLPKETWNNIGNLPISDRLKQVLTAIKHGANYEMMEPTTLVLRNYIRKGTDVILTATDPLGNNFFRLMFQLIQEIYNKGPDIATGQIQMDSCTALLINWIQNKQEISQQLCVKFWQVAQYNIFKTKSQVLKVLNCQLISMMIWAGGDRVIQYLKSVDKLDAVFKQLTSYTQQIIEEHQRQRLILGLSTIICSKCRYDQTLKHFPTIYNTLIKLVKENIEVRLQENPLPQQDEDDQGQDSGTQEDEEELLQKILAGGEDDGLDQCWQQYYGENYSSKLDDIDELEFFKNVMQKIEREEPTFYKQMQTIIPIDQLSQVGKKLQKAISLANKQQ